MNTQIGRRIKQLRSQRGWSQEEVAYKLHISQATYARIEKGETNSWAAYIKEIGNIFEISPDELLKPDSLFNTQENHQSQVYNATTINFLSEKMVEQYEKRIAEKDQLIVELKQQLKNQ